ncbi:MAG TPA: hypothetical protein VFC78_12765, partial [Tepidisphaeraceae bacterium]|nr:hypothetical protein [Tepidisphaeraceae bacterium]
DEIAVAATERMTYVCALEQVARFTLGLPQPDYFNGLAVAFGGQRPDLLHRIKHLLEMPTPHSRNNWPAGALAIALLVVSVGVSRSAGQKAATRPTLSHSEPPHLLDSGIAPANDDGATGDALLTPVEQAAKETRELARRSEKRAELDVEEATLTLQGKKNHLAALERLLDATGRKRHLVPPIAQAASE